jgi:hypothetical protein
MATTWRSNAVMYVAVPYNKVSFSHLYFLTSQSQVDFGIVHVHNEELNDLYSSPTTVRVMKLRRMKWAGHVVHMEEGRGKCRVLVGKP